MAAGLVVLVALGAGASGAGLSSQPTAALRHIKYAAAMEKLRMARMLLRRCANATRSPH